MKNNLKILGLVIIFFVYFIFAQITHIYIPCLFHEITHLYCPGCGVTRMLFSMVKGDLKSAFSYNQLLFISTPIIVFLVIDLIICNFLNKEPLYKRIPNWIYYLYLVLLILFMIIRNIFPVFSPSGI